MKQTSTFPGSMHRVSHSAILLAVLFCTFLTSGGFLFACWRMMHLQHEQQTETLQEVRRFHRLLLDDLRKLVNQSAPQATEDLCQVRFRLREEDGWGYPSESFQLNLHRHRDRKWELLSKTECGIDKSPPVDFGLVPPGDYRLDIINSIGMICEHEFRVLPGVPVDRAIRCPHHSGADPNQSVVHLPLELIWPAEWKSLPIVAVYHLEGGRKTLGRWEWRPAPRQRFRRWVVRGPAIGPRLEERLFNALPETLYTDPVPPTIEGPDVGTLQIPYFRCELTAVSFLLGHPEKQTPLIYLGSFGFTDKGHAVPPEFFAAQNTTMLPHPRPHWELNKAKPTTWEIRLPVTIVQQIKDRVERELQKDQSAAREKTHDLFDAPNRIPLNVFPSV